MCAPPGADGEVNAVVLGACRLAGASVVYRMGGAQAIAALAYGTETVTPVDVIVGPGNLYVQEAKRQVFGQVGIDGFAGPSDLLVIADGDGRPRAARARPARPGRARPRHAGGGASPTRGELLDALAERIGAEAPRATAAVVRLVEVAELEQALGARRGVRARAPAARRARAPRRWRRRHAAPAACSSAPPAAPRSATTSPAPTTCCRPAAPRGSPRRCRPRTSAAASAEVRIGDGASALARAAAPIARAEGFELHARSMEARIRDNGAR